MPKPIADGDYVTVSDRATTPADTKSQLFYEHYRCLAGTVIKVYADGTASVRIDPGSLPQILSARHATSADVVRKKFLGELSEEGRNKLSAAEKKFDISYTILVATSDLAPAAQPKPQAAQPAAAPAAEAAAEPASLFDVAGQPSGSGAAPAAGADAPHRPTLEDLERAEQEHLDALRRKPS